MLLLSKQTMRELLSARALQQESPHTLPHVARARTHTHALQQSPMMCIVHTNPCLVWMELIIWLFGFLCIYLTASTALTRALWNVLLSLEGFLNLTFLLSMHRLSIRLQLESTYLNRQKYQVILKWDEWGVIFKFYQHYLIIIAKPKPNSVPN